MKKVLIATLAIFSFGLASFAQTTPSVKKNEPAKTQVVKKTPEKKVDEKNTTLNKTTKSKTPAVEKTTANTTPAVPTKSVAKTNPATAVKKDGTAETHNKANKKHS